MLDTELERYFVPGICKSVGDRLGATSNCAPDNTAGEGSLFPFFLEEYDISEPINLSTARSTSIRELTELTGELTGYRGKIVWDRSKPDGKVLKIFDNAKMKALDLDCPTMLREGLKKTIDWFAENYSEGTIRL